MLADWYAFYTIYQCAYMVMKSLIFKGIFHEKSLYLFIFYTKKVSRIWRKVLTLKLINGIIIPAYEYYIK